MWLLLHGFTGSPRSWTRVLAHARLDKPPLVPTLAGHGRDWRSRRVDTLQDEIARIVSLVSNAERPRLLCGYSMGARVASSLLVGHPNLFDAAVLIGVHPGLTDEFARTERRRADARWTRLLREQGLPAFVAAWEAQPLFESQRTLPREALAAQRDIRLSHDAEGLARSLEVLGLAETPDVRSAMRSLEIPVTFVTGSLDSKFRELAAALANDGNALDAQVVDSVGHNVVLEAPAAVSALLRRAEENVLG